MIRASGELVKTLVPSTLPLPDLNRLDEHLGRYRDLFSRADQARSFALYVRGLLGRGHRKNVESIAGRLREVNSPPADLAQSLQHFLTQSPWNADRVLARYRSLLCPSPAVKTWVVHDGIVPKKGRHSVGVHRQFARSIGRKLNCQVAVLVSEVSGTTIPLTGRLYLPGYWLREHAPLVQRTIPGPFRQVRSKAEVALDLIDDLLPQGRPDRILAEEGYGKAEIFRDGLVRRNLVYDDTSIGSREAVRLAQTGFDRLKEHLGLSHFEGRTWVGWHHHFALVLVAFGFDLQQGAGWAAARDTLSSLPAN